MEKGIREKIALVIFALLIVLGGWVLISYFSTGRSWSVAATIVDDTVGEMDGYTAIVFSGTLSPHRHSTPYGGSASQTTNGIVSSESRESSTAALGSRILELIYRSGKMDRYDGVYVSDVRDIYERKGADALTIDVSDPTSFFEPRVYEVGDRMIGIFALNSYMTASQLDKVISGLHDEGAQDIICIAPKTNMLATCEGIDVVLLTQEVDEDLTTKADTRDTLIYVTPESTEVGVILFTHNGVPSSRTIDEV